MEGIIVNLETGQYQIPFVVDIEAHWKLIWDYRGWKQYGFPSAQKDWNQTLFTRINQLSAQIHMATLYGPADRICMHPLVFAIVKTFEMMQIEDDGSLTVGRYKITVNDKLPSDKIYVLRESAPNENEERDLTKEVDPLKLIGEITITGQHIKYLDDYFEVGK